MLLVIGQKAYRLAEGIKKRKTVGVWSNCRVQGTTECLLTRKA